MYNFVVESHPFSELFIVRSDSIMIRYGVTFTFQSSFTPLTGLIDAKLGRNVFGLYSILIR